MTQRARAHLTAPGRGVRAAQGRRVLPGPAHDAAGLQREPELYGAGYTDINAVLPAKEILAYISIIVAIAIIVFSNAVMRNLVWPGALAGAAGRLGRGDRRHLPVVRAAVRGEAERQARRRRRTSSAASTRPARRSGWRTTRSPRTRRATWPRGSLANDNTVVDNIRLLDPSWSRRPYTQFQQVRGFYDFPEKLDIDRYTVDGKTQDYVVGLREINYEELPEPAEQLDQPAHRLHPRLRHGRRPGQPGASAAVSRTSSPASSASRPTRQRCVRARRSRSSPSSRGSTTAS